MTPEAKLKKRCRELAIEAGCKMYPASFKGRRGFPDYALLVPARAFVLVEFKREDGGVLSEHQVSTIIDLRMAGQEVWVVYTEAQFRDWLGNALARPTRLS